MAKDFLIPGESCVVITNDVKLPKVNKYEIIQSDDTIKVSLEFEFKADDYNPATATVNKKVTPHQNGYTAFKKGNQSTNQSARVRFRYDAASDVITLAADITGQGKKVTHGNL